MRITLHSVYLGLFALAGCGAPPEVEVESQAIANGNAFTGSDRLVFLSTNSCDGKSVDFCTGTLLTNEWVLSAAHCGYSCNAPNITIAYFNNVMSRGARVVGHPSLDVALIKLDTPMSIYGSTTGFKSSLWTHTSESLFGGQYEAQGFGEGSCGGGDKGTMRRGNMTAFAADQWTLAFSAINGQSTAEGDSGGPFWKFFRGVPFQVGVTSSGACGIASYAVKPENFEQWAFEVVYNAPIHIPTTDSRGRGRWNVPGSNAEFWHRPLYDNWTQFGPYFNPCAGTTNPYKWTADYQLETNGDYIYVQNDSGFYSLTGTQRTTNTSSGRMRLAYSTNQSTPSNGMNWMTVQCDYGDQQPAALVCHGARCATTRDPLPNGFSQSVSWNPCNGGAFYYYVDYSFLPYWDGMQIGSTSYSGTAANVYGFSSGPTTVSVTANSNASRGLQSLKAICQGW